MITHHEIQQWTNLSRWSDIHTIDMIDIDLNLIFHTEDLKRLLLAIENSTDVLKINFLDYQVRNIHFLIFVVDWIMKHGHRIERLGFDITFAPLMIEDWIVQIDNFEIFILQLNKSFSYLIVLKHLSINFDLRFLYLPQLMNYFSKMLHNLAHPESLETLQMGLIGGGSLNIAELHQDLNYFSSQLEFANGFYALKNLKQLELKFSPLERSTQHKYIYTDASSNNVCYAEEYIANWVKQHDHLRTVHWDMFYNGLFEIGPIIQILGNALIQNVSCKTHCPQLPIFVDNELNNPIFYHQKQIERMGKILKFHPHLLSFHLDCSIDKIQYVNRRGFPFTKMPAYVHAQVVDLLLRPLSENKLLQQLSLDLGREYPEMVELFKDNSNLYDLDLIYNQQKLQMRDRVKENAKALDVLINLLLEQSFLKMSTNPKTRTLNACHIISPREIHRIDHLLWIRAYPAFISLTRNVFHELHETRNSSLALAQLIIGLYIGDLSKNRFGQDICMHIAQFLNYIPDMFQLHLMQGGILRRGMVANF